MSTVTAQQTPWELWASGQEPAGEDMRRRFAEYEACASDAERAYISQLRNFGHQKAPVAA